MQIKSQYAGMINAVSFDDGSEFHTMDDYSQDLSMNDHEDEEEDHWQDDPSSFTAMPAALWSNCEVSVKPDERPSGLMTWQTKLKLPGCVKWVLSSMQRTLLEPQSMSTS